MALVVTRNPTTALQAPRDKSSGNKNKSLCQNRGPVGLANPATGGFSERREDPPQGQKKKADNNHCRVKYLMRAGTIIVELGAKFRRTDRDGIALCETSRARAKSCSKRKPGPRGEGPRSPVRPKGPRTGRSPARETTTGFTLRLVGLRFSSCCLRGSVPLFIFLSEKILGLRDFLRDREVHLHKIPYLLEKRPTVATGPDAQCRLFLAGLRIFGGTLSSLEP